MGNVNSKLMSESEVKKGLCQHVADIEHYEEQLRELTRDKDSIEKKLLWLNEVVQEL